MSEELKKASCGCEISYAVMGGKKVVILSYPKQFPPNLKDLKDPAVKK